MPAEDSGEDIGAGLTRAAALSRARAALRGLGAPTAGREARILVEAALDLTPADLALRGDAPVDGPGRERLTGMLRRRLSGEPVARILGAWEFWGLPFQLSPATLVPRPDTETLVEAALAPRPDRDAPCAILDLGTGSGCILVALLSELRSARGIGIDRSEEALRTARGNAAANGVGARAAFVAGAWWDAIGVRARFDLVVANPPYIAAGAIADLDPAVRVHDPHLALDGGPDGLAAYRAILPGAAERVTPGGALVVEVGFDQARAVADIGARAGLGAAMVLNDLADHARAVRFDL